MLGYLADVCPASAQKLFCNTRLEEGVDKEKTRNDEDKTLSRVDRLLLELLPAPARRDEQKTP